MVCLCVCLHNGYGVNLCIVVLLSEFAVPKQEKGSRRDVFFNGQFPTLQWRRVCRSKPLKVPIPLLANLGYPSPLSPVQQFPESRNYYRVLFVSRRG